MPAKSITAEAALLALAVSSLFATAPVPRKAPELKFLDPSGKEILLSSFGGKVVIIEFMLVKCPHCLRVAQMINKLNGELGPRGFQPVGSHSRTEPSGTRGESRGRNLPSQLPQHVAH